VEAVEVRIKEGEVHQEEVVAEEMEVIMVQRVKEDKLIQEVVAAVQEIQVEVLEVMVLLY
jgi:hypothetical protein